MTTASEIITQAFREGNIVAVGQSPTTAEVNEALPRLNNVVSSLIGYEIGEYLHDWPIPDPSPEERPYYRIRHIHERDIPPVNSRILLDIASPKTVYFPAYPSDGSRMSAVDVGMSAALTIDGNSRLIEGAQTLSVAAADLPKNWFYRADLSDWKPIKKLVEADEMPLPEEFDDLFVTALLVRLAPRFGVSVPQGTGSAFRRMLSQAKARYKQNIPVQVDPVFAHHDQHEAVDADYKFFR